MGGGIRSGQPRRERWQAVTAPSKETIDAALRLASAADEFLECADRTQPLSTDKLRAAQKAYRATLPKPPSLEELLAAVRSEVKRAKDRFHWREHGGTIQGDFYDAVKAILADEEL